MNPDNPALSPHWPRCVVSPSRAPSGGTMRIVRRAAGRRASAPSRAGGSTLDPACDPCALLFCYREGSKYRRVPRRVDFLSNFQLADEEWEALHLPINLAFFLHSSTAGRVVAFYPSPAGAMESLVGLDAWAELTTANPILRELEPDVEALLVNRVGETREVYRVGIDLCYHLAGLIRLHWRGLAGGQAVWDEIGRFFAGLKERLGHA